MPHAPSPHPPSSPPTQSSAVTTTNDLTPKEQSHLKNLLAHKLHGIPAGHILSITVVDILHATPRTHLPHIPHDINLPFFLRNRALIDDANCVPLKAESGQHEDVARAIWYYRLDGVRQFQRWHDGTRWNIAIYAALLTAHMLQQDRRTARHEHSECECDDDQKRRRGRRQDTAELKLSPAAGRFMKAYLAAVLEHHSSPTAFKKREEFIRLWRDGNLDVHTIHKSWAKRVLQKEMKRLSKEWEHELGYARRKTNGREYGDRVERFVGSLIPGRADQNRVTRMVGEGDVRGSKEEGGICRPRKTSCWMR